MAKYRVETDKGVYEIETEDAAPAAVAPATPPEKPSYLEMASQAVNDFAQGVGAGAFSTVRGAGKLLGYESPTLNLLATPPESLAGKAGYYGEQGAEFLLPGLGITKGAKLLQAAPKVAQIAGRAGLEAAGAAGVSALQSGGDPEAIRNAAIGGGVAGGLTAAAPMAVPLLRQGAVTQYSRVLNPTKEKTKAITQKIVPELIRRGEWAPTIPRMLTRAQERVQYFGKKIDDVWDQMAKQGATMDIAPILQRLDDIAVENFTTTNAAGQLIPLEGPAERGLQELRRIAQNIANASTVDPATGARVVPAKALRKLRDYWDDIVDKAGGFQKDLDSTTVAKAYRDARETVRELIAQSRPDLAKVNKEFSFWKNLETVNEATSLRRTGQAKPLTRQLMRAAGIGAGTTAGGAVGGLAGGGIGAVLGGAGMEAFQTLVSSPAWGTVSAVTKDRLADAIAQGNKAKVQFYLAQALKAAGMAAITRPARADAKALAPTPAK